MKNVAKVIMAIVLILTIPATFISIIRNNYEENRNKRNEERIINQLEDKYGNGRFEIIDRDQHKCTGTMYCEPITTLTISTNYMGDTFEVIYNSRYSYSYIDNENFLEVYYEDKWKGQYNSLEEYLEAQVGYYRFGDAVKGYEGKISIKSEGAYCDYKYNQWGEVPSIKTLTESCSVFEPTIEVSNYYTSSNLEEFLKDATTVYERLINNREISYYGDKHINLVFVGQNPYSEGNRSYYNKGYIRLDSTRQKYMVYVTSSPKEVERIKDVTIYQ